MWERLLFSFLVAFCDRKWVSRLSALVAVKKKWKLWEGRRRFRDLFRSADLRFTIYSWITDAKPFIPVHRLPAASLREFWCGISRSGTSSRKCQKFRNDPVWKMTSYFNFKIGGFAKAMRVKIISDIVAVVIIFIYWFIFTLFFVRVFFCYVNLSPVAIA